MGGLVHRSQQLAFGEGRRAARAALRHGVEDERGAGRGRLRVCEDEGVPDLARPGASLRNEAGECWNESGRGADEHGRPRCRPVGNLQIIDPPEGKVEPSKKFAVYFFGTKELGFLKPGDLEDARNEALKKRLQGQHRKKKQWRMGLEEMMLQMQREEEGIDQREEDGEADGNDLGAESQGALLELAVAAKEADTGQEKRKRDVKTEANKVTKNKKAKKEKEKGKQDTRGTASTDPQMEKKLVETEDVPPAEFVEGEALAPGPLPPDAQAVLHLKEVIRDRLAAFEENSIKSHKAEEKAEQAMRKAMKLQNESELAKKALRQDARELEEILRRLGQEKVTIEVLESTNIGIAVKKWRKKELKDPMLAGAADVCKQILGKWMGLITVSPKDSTMHRKGTENHVKKDAEHERISNTEGAAEVGAEPLGEWNDAERETTPPVLGDAEKGTQAPEAPIQQRTEQVEYHPRPPSTPKVEKGETPGGEELKDLLTEAHRMQGDPVKPSVQERFEISTGSTLRDKGRKILKRHIQDIDKVGAGVRALELTMDLEQELCKHLGVNAGEEPGRAYKLLVQAVCNRLDGNLGHKLLSGGVAPKEMVRLSTQFSR